MILRITRGRLRAGTWQEFERNYQDRVVNAGPIEGLRARWLALDLDDPDAGVVMSLWDTLDHVLAYEHGRLFQEVIQAALRPYFVGDFHTTHCQVKIAEAGQISATS